LHYLSATYVAIIALAEPIGLGKLTFILLGEMITEPAAIGAILVLPGIYVASRAELGSRACTTDSTT
jgi:drug/metabolite transporter (DMT)-like permease